VGGAVLGCIEIDGDGGCQGIFKVIKLVYFLRKSPKVES
jgi:hypothetical protein